MFATNATANPTVQRLRLRSTSEIGLKAGLRGDVWAAMTPDRGVLAPAIAQGDKVFADIGDKLPAGERARLLGQALGGLANRYVSAAPTATFRLITSPLVTWIWLGAIIVFLGGLVAMWPGERDALRRRVRAGYAARVARDLGRAGPRGAQTVAASGPPAATD